jgi:hypothetical protein
LVGPKLVVSTPMLGQPTDQQRLRPSSESCHRRARAWGTR